MMFFKKIKSNNGFTLAEMMVTLMIFGLIFTLALVNFRRGERLEAFRLAVEQVASNLRLAQTSALTGISEDETLAQAYGVYFTLDQSNQYLLFKDQGDRMYGDGDQLVETIILPEEITLSNLTSDPLTIVFEPPKPTIYINGDIILATAQIDLARAYFPDKVGRITLNRLTGQVSARLINQ